MKKFKQYFANQLPDEENEVITQVLLNNYFDRALEERWGQKLKKQYELQNPQKNKTKKTVWLRRITAVAATFLCLIGCYNLYNSFNRLTTQDLVALHLQKPYDHPSIRKGANEENNRTLGANAYANEEYKTAIYFFEKVIQLNDNNIDDHFFLGLSNLYLGKNLAAIQSLEKALVIEPTPTSGIRSKQIINWYLGLAYLKHNQVKEAKQVLQKIVGPKKLKEKVEELLKSI